MSKKPIIDFSGAEFRTGGTCINVLPDGSEINHRSTLYITLADGTRFQKSIWYPHNWEKWIKQQLSPHSPWVSDHGFWRKVSHRQAELLQTAWDEFQELAT